MNYPLTGYHHITACAGGAQEDVNFFTQVVGLRMAKQTVLMDGSIPIYHLYYSNANLEPGSVMTPFPYSRKPGRPGSGQVSATAFTCPREPCRSGKTISSATKWIRILWPSGSGSPSSDSGIPRVWRSK